MRCRQSIQRRKITVEEMIAEMRQYEGTQFFKCMNCEAAPFATVDAWMEHIKASHRPDEFCHVTLAEKESNELDGRTIQ